jgi:hypothetical protein
MEKLLQKHGKSWCSVFGVQVLHFGIARKEKQESCQIKVAPFLECGNSFAALLISALSQDREPPVLGRTATESPQFRPFPTPSESSGYFCDSLARLRR